jgi:hypothetical protein
MHFDPRDYDSRDDERWAPFEGRDEDARTLGRGPGNDRQDSDGHAADHRDDARRLERDRGGRERGRDPRDTFTRSLHPPGGLDRERVLERDREYTLRGSETRTLATVGAFRVVSSRHLRDHHDRASDPRGGDLRHLREQGLIDTGRLDGRRDVAVVLTDRGHDLLEHHRDRDADTRQEFYAGLRRARELEHDVQVYNAFLSVVERLDAREAHIDRIVLDYELKREYQQWLHERDRDRDDYDGHPDRDAREIEAWALEHELPYFDERVHFPDLRIEYEESTAGVAMRTWRS